MTLPEVTSETIDALIDTLKYKDSEGASRANYEDLYTSQPMLANMCRATLEYRSEQFAQGYLQGVFHCWYLLSQQELINSLERLYNDDS